MTETKASVREVFLRRAGMTDPSFREVVNAIKNIPHGRPRERSAKGVVEDWRGTCSTKLLLLREVCPEQSMRLFNRVFRLTPAAALPFLGPDAALAVPAEGMIDVHTYARVLVGDAWVTVDVTFQANLGTDSQIWDYRGVRVRTSTRGKIRSRARKR